MEQNPTFLSSQLITEDSVVLARRLLAASTFFTLILNSSEVLFRPLGRTVDFDFLIPNLFVVMQGHLQIAVALALVILAASFFLPRIGITAVFHWWVSYSFATGCTLVDGGDQINQILTLGLIPLSVFYFTSARKLKIAPALVTNLSWLITLQVACIYFQASTAKFSAPVWSNGTALYYWLLDEVHGAPEMIQALLRPLFSSAPILVFATWFVLAFEMMLSVSFLLPRQQKNLLFFSGVLFHLGIALVHGLPSFVLTMIGALVLFLKPTLMPVSIPFIRMERKKYETMPLGL